MAQGGFIRHHEQYNELTAGAHRHLECVTCHDPHTSVRYAALQGAQAVVTQCEECHSGARSSLQTGPLAAVKGNVACESCHMPPAVKSAVAFGPFVADIASHIVRIDADPAAEQFEGGFSKPYLTLDFACLGCHEDKDRAWAASYVHDVHGPGFSARRTLAQTRIR